VRSKKKMKGPTYHYFMGGSHLNPCEQHVYTGANIDYDAWGPPGWRSFNVSGRLVW
jgi:hypothetical protein